jgi:alanine dehydrogenase
MILGIPKEIKNNEFRVGLTPQSIKSLVKNNHEIIVESNAGIGSGFSDDDYMSAGAKILKDSKDIFKNSELIIKVKEPQLSEIQLLKPDQILFTYLHLASSKQLTEQLLESKCISVAYETITSDSHGLPLLTPMSEIAGRLSIQAGAKCLEKHSGGSGILLGGSSYSPPANTLVIGGGVVGYNAALIADGMKSNLTILEKNLERIDFLKNEFPKAKILNIDDIEIENIISDYDLIIGAVLIPGAQAPQVIQKKHLQLMKHSCVMVDVAIDQGGCFETSKATTHEDPTYIIDNVIHYCVANMPGAVPRTSTISLNTVTLPYILKLADSGIKAFCESSFHHLNGLSTYKGKLTYKPVADLFKFSYSSPADIF